LPKNKKSPPGKGGEETREAGWRICMMKSRRSQPGGYNQVTHRQYYIKDKQIPFSGQYFLKKFSMFL